MATTTNDVNLIARRWFARLNYEVRGPHYGSPVIEIRAIGVQGRDVTAGSGLGVLPSGGWIDFDPCNDFTEDALIDADSDGSSLYLYPNDISYRAARQTFGEV